MLMSNYTNIYNYRKNKGLVSVSFIKKVQLKQTKVLSLYQHIIDGKGLYCHHMEKHQWEFNTKI